MMWYDHGSWVGWLWMSVLMVLTAGLVAALTLCVLWSVRDEAAKDRRRELLDGGHTKAVR